ncbi:MAG: hypothetical protein NC218_10030 [Acetobacter sp.]|nr:hypothetical protein [Acetobacter sp.]
MKKFLYILVCILFSTNLYADDELAKDKIYFFTHTGCPYCEMAEKHIAQNRSNAAIEVISIDKPEGFYLFKKCAEKFKLGKNIGTPLFCIGDEYLMGWSTENQQRFDELSSKFIQ